MENAQRLMTVFEAIVKRRAVRAYRPDTLDKDTVRELLKAAVRAPTAMHAEPWAFAVIQGRPLLKRYSDLAKATWSTEQNGSHAIAHPTAPSHAQAASMFAHPDFNLFYNASTLIVIGARTLGGFVAADCWLAAENLMLAACAMGLGTCCIGSAVPVLNRTDVKAELQLPPDFQSVAPIIVGLPSGETPATTRRDPDVLCWRTE